MDIEFKKLLAGDSWAQDGDRVDMDDTSVQPTIDRGQGYTIDFSTTTTPTRARINQILRELYGAAKEVRMGVSTYDAEVDYPQGAICQVDGNLYYALQAHSSSSPVNPITLGQTTWTGIGGRSASDRTKPATLAVGNIFIDGDSADNFAVWWYAPDNGGYEITQTRLQYSKTQTFPSASTTTIDSYTPGTPVPISGNDSDLYYVRLQSRNFIDWSQYSAAKRVRSTPLTPGAINTMTVQPTGVAGSAIVRWLKPETNGLSVTQYRIQWKQASESFSTTERNKIITSSATSFAEVISGLSQSIIYTFRVNPISNRGTENESGNQATARPVPNTTVPGKPVISASADSSTSVRAWLSALLDNGNDDINFYEWSYQNTGDTGWTTLPNTAAPAIRFERDRGDTSQVRMRANNDDGYSPYSDAVPVALFSPSAPDAPIISASSSFDVVPSAVKGIVSFSMGNMTSPEVVKDRIIQTAIQWKRSSESNWKVEESATSGANDNRFGVPQVFPVSGDLPIGVPIDVQSRWRNAGGWSDWTSTTVIPSIVAPSASLVVDPGSISTTEGFTETIRVKLSREPVETTTVTMTTSNTDITISPSSLTFGQSNWNAYKSFTITSIVDTDEVADTATLTLSATGGLTIPNVTIPVTIKEALELIVSDDINIIAGQNTQIIMSVNRQPPSNIDIDVEDISNDDFFNILPRTLQITPSNWKTAQVFNVNNSVNQNSDIESSDFEFSISGAIEDTITRSVTGYRITPSNNSVHIQKAGLVRAVVGQSTATQVRLSRAPIGDARVNISPMRSFLSVDKTHLDFNRTNWFTYQTINITAAADAPLSATDYIMLTADDSNEVGSTFLPVMTVSAINTAGMFIIPQSNANTYPVSLNARPSSDTTVVISDMSFPSNQLNSSPASLVFTSSNWNTSQNIILQGSNINTTDSGTLTLRATGGIAASRIVPVTLLERTNILSSSVQGGSSIIATRGVAVNMQLSLLNAPLENVVFPNSTFGLDGRDVDYEQITFTPTNYVNISFSITFNFTGNGISINFSPKGVSGNTSLTNINGLTYSLTVNAP